MNNDVRQIILVKNTETAEQPCASVVTRPNLENCVQILSHPTINWLDELHPDILGHSFTISPIVICDISDVESEYHKVYPTSKYDKDKYFDETMPRILEAIEDTYSASVEANDMIGEWINPVVSYIDFTQYIGPVGRVVPSFKHAIDSSGTKYLVYFFNHIDRSTVKFTKTRGVCVYNVESGETQAFYDVEKFIKSLTQDTYAFAGDLDRLNNCSTIPDEITDNLVTALKSQIEDVRIPSYDSVSDGFKQKLSSL